MPVWGVSGGPSFGLRTVKAGKWVGDGTYSNQIVIPAVQLIGIKMRTSKGELEGDDAIVARHARAIAGSGSLRFGSVSLPVLELITGRSLQSAGSTPNRKKRIRITGGQDFPYFGLCGKASSDVGGDIHVFIAKAKIADDFDVFQLEYDKFSIPEVPFEALADAVYQVSGTTEVQTVTVTGTPTGGTFTLAFRGQTTAGVAYNANAAAVQSALQAITTIGAGGATVSGSGPYVVTFAGALALQAVELLVASGAGLTGGTSPSVTVARTTPGVDPQDTIFDIIEHETAESVVLPPVYP